MVVRGTAIQAGAAPGTVVPAGATVVDIMAMLATMAGATLAADITEPPYAARVAFTVEAFTGPAGFTAEVVSMAAVADSMVEAGSTAVVDIDNGSSDPNSQRPAALSCRPFLFVFSVASLYHCTHSC